MRFLGVLALAALVVATGARATAAEMHFLDRPEGRLAYADSGGSGALVILLPGMGDLSGEYRFVAPALTKAGYRVIAMDNRGQGLSSAVWPDYSAQAIGGDVLALIDALGGQPATIIGTSFAAGAGLWAAHDRPESIRALVMISPVLRDLPIGFFTRAALWVGFAGPWDVGVWLSYWDSLFPLHKPDDHAAYRAALAENLRQTGRMQALRQMVTLSKAATEAIIDQQDKPALLVMGSADPDFADPTQEAQSLARRSHADLLIVAGAGHYPQVEAPDQVSRAILDFLAGLR